MSRLVFMVWWSMLLLTRSVVCAENTTIVVTSSTEKETLKKAEDSLHKLLPDSQTHILQYQKRYILELGPYESNDRLTLAFLEVRKKFPEAFIRLPEQAAKKAATSPKIVTKTIYIDKPVYIEKEDETLWIALFGLAIIGIFALFLSSDQIRQMRKKYIQMQKRQDEIEEKQSFLLEKMGEQIQEGTIKSLEEENKLLDINLKGADPKIIEKHIENLKEQDEDLLRTTYEMIDVLKIKSGNIVIKEEPFQLSNMLHILTNAVSSLLRIETRKLYYDIDPAISRYIVGDSVRTHQVLSNLLTYTLESALDANVTLSISIVEDKALLFEISNVKQYIEKEEIDRLFIPSSWEELQESSKQYSFFVTKELVSRMKGSLVISSRPKEGTKYQLRLPYVEDEKRQSKREALQEVLKGKKVLMVDQSIEEARILKQILEVFDTDVQFTSAETFHQMKPDIDQVELVFLRPQDINPLNLQFFKTLHANKRIKIILVHDLFPAEDLGFIVAEVANAELYKPVIIGDVEEVLTQLYLQENHPNQELIHNEEVMQRFRIESTENVTRDAFRDFAGKSVMVVEDNDVNQKVLTSILEAADIEVHQVENGRQALALLNQGVQIDLILMDMNMPVMDGFEATRKIKDEPLFKKIPVIAVSGLGFYHELERMQFVGVDACIIKPFKLGQLYEGLRRYLGINTLPEASVHVSSHRYEPPEQLLNVKRGIHNVHNEIFYREILQEVRETLDHSDKYVSDLIFQGRIDELQAFCRDSLSLVDTVGAKQIAKIFKEILVFISVGERKSLVEYVPLYKRAWKLLDREIARYLGSATKE